MDPNNKNSHRFHQVHGLLQVKGAHEKHTYVVTRIIKLRSDNARLHLQIYFNVLKCFQNMVIIEYFDG